MSSVALSEVTTTHTTGGARSRRQQERRGQRADDASVGGRAAPGPARTIAPPSVLRVAAQETELEHEKTRMTRNSTHAMADAEPKWKKFWNAVS